MLRVALLISLIALASTIPYLDKRCLAASLVVGKDNYEDLYNWDCKVCSEENKPVHAHYIEEKAKDVKCVLTVYDDFMILAFRYTNTALNIWEDILYPFQVKDAHMCPKCKVQSQYHKMWEAIKEDVINDLRSMQKETGIKKLWVTGISMGGGLTTISMVDLLKVLKDDEKVFADIDCMTFGSPRVGNNQWADHFDSVTMEGRLHRRYIIKGDPIVVMPRCLSLLCTYQQTGVQLVCKEDDMLCVQTEDEASLKFTFDRILSKFDIDSHMKDLDSIIDHINGYPKLYNMTLITK